MSPGAGLRSCTNCHAPFTVALQWPSGEHCPLCLARQDRKLPPLRSCTNCFAFFSVALQWPTGEHCPLCLARQKSPRRRDGARPRTGATAARSARWERRVRVLLLRDGDRCWLCHEQLAIETTGERRVTLDHYTPKSKGGTAALVNLRLAHAECNTRRGNADPSEAPAGRLLLLDAL